MAGILGGDEINVSERLACSRRQIFKVSDGCGDDEQCAAHSALDSDDLDKVHVLMTAQLHPARQSTRKASSILLILLALTLSACETTGTGAYTSSAEERAERLAWEGEHSEAANVYIGLAAEETGVERDRLTLLAVEQWLDAGDLDRARSALRSVTDPAAGELDWMWGASAATLMLAEGEAQRASDMLERLSRESLTPALRLRVQALRADAYFQLGDATRAIELMQQREGWLDDPRSIERNRQRLWQGLLVSNPQQLRAEAEVALDSTVRGLVDARLACHRNGTAGYRLEQWGRPLAQRKRIPPGIEHH